MKTKDAIEKFENDVLFDKQIEDSKLVDKKFNAVFGEVEKAGTETTAHLVINNQAHGKKHPYQCQYGDKLRLALASDKKEAMFLFGTHDSNRVNRYALDSFFLVNVFEPHGLIPSDYDPSRYILEFPLR
jgi:hypothetical protein